MTLRIPDGTVVCYTGTGEFQAVIGGYNGVDHLLTQRSDDGRDVWTSRFKVGKCSSIPEQKGTPWLLIGAAIILLYLLTRR